MARRTTKKWHDRLPGGLADKLTPDDFDSAALVRGIKVELEHTSDRRLATEIAMDHLVEDKDYYKKLATIEAHAKPKKRRKKRPKAKGTLASLLRRALK